MPSKKRFNPKTRAQDERIIERVYKGSGNGLVTDTFRVPSDSFGELWNAKDHKVEVRGRQGSFLHTIADRALLPGEITGTLADAFASGPLKDLEVGDIFQTYSWKDFSGNELYNIKVEKQYYQTPIVMAYDLFKVNQLSPLDVEYLGNIAVPPKDNFYPTQAYEMTATKNEYVITLTNSPDINTSLIGTYFNWGYLSGSGDYTQYRDLIVDIDGTDIIVQDKGGVSDNIEYSYCMIQGPIYASFDHQELGKVVIQAEDRLYESNSPIDGWREIPGIYEARLVQSSPSILSEKRPQESEGIFHAVNRDLILSNNNGHYRVIFNNNGNYYYKINEQKPEQRVDPKAIKVWGFKESESDESIEIVGFPGYGSTSDRAGNTYYTDGIIL